MVRQLTPEEIKVLDLAGETMALFSQLEQVHPSDLGEMQFHVHGIQNIVLARPAYESMRHGGDKLMPRGE